MAQSAGVIHIHAHLQRFLNRVGAIHGEHREELLDRKRILPSHPFDRRDEQLGLRLNGDPDEARDVGSFLADGHRLHVAGRQIDHGAAQDLGLLLVADVRAQLLKFLQHAIVDLVVDDDRLLGGANRAIVESL